MDSTPPPKLHQSPWAIYIALIFTACIANDSAVDSTRDRIGRPRREEILATFGQRAKSFLQQNQLFRLTFARFSASFMVGTIQSVTFSFERLPQITYRRSYGADITTFS
jgi:hypothetical protein